VREVCVSPGDRVAAGHALVVMENPELEINRDDLQLSLAQSRLRARTHQRNGRMADFQAELATQHALTQRLAELDVQLSTLVIRAPRTGVVVGRSLSSLEGRVLSVGAELMKIAAPHEKEILVSIDQDDVDDFRTMIGRQLLVCAYPGQVFSCALEEVQPRGNDEIEHQALAVSAGGPLAIRAAGAGNAASSESPDWRYVKPRFSGLLKLNGETSRKLHSGQLAELKLTTKHRTLGGQCYRSARQWLNRQRAGA
jgi:multidrug resistance efflux pump